MPLQPDDDGQNTSTTTLMGRPFAVLDSRAQRVARHIDLRQPITRHPEAVASVPSTRGQRAADAVTTFGGSWLFVGLFAIAMLLWVGLNALLLVVRGQTFDPYPFILLNLFLSMLAAVQAPIILMSQNRQSEKDRTTAGHDYEVNLKAELEIMLLHDKLDQLREQQWTELLTMQTEQMRLLAALVEGLPPASDSTPTPSHLPERGDSIAGPTD
ncbi:DUF1003 domain-containing protein [Burkholderiaceae bacterium UC74_6]